MKLNERLKAGGAILALAFLVQVGVTTFMERRLVASNDAERLNSVAMHNHMQADMLHDAIRGSVYRALHAAQKGNANERDAAIAEVSDYSRDIRGYLNANRALNLDEDIKVSLTSVARDLDAYTGSATTVANLVRTDPATAEQKVGELEQAFDTLEASQDKVANALDKRQASLDHSSDNLGVTSLVASAVVSLAFAGFLGWILVQLRRIVVRPLQRLALQLDLMSAGNLSQEIDVGTSEDEMAAVQRAVQTFQQATRESRAAEQPSLKSCRISRRASMHCLEVISRTGFPHLLLHAMRICGKLTIAVLDTSLNSCAMWRSLRRASRQDQHRSGPQRMT